MGGYTYFAKRDNEGALLLPNYPSACSGWPPATGFRANGTS